VELAQHLMRSPRVVAPLALSALLAVAGDADAQALPGTHDDVGPTLALVPSVLDIPFGRFAVRGGSEADTLLLFDGFAIPRLNHVLGLRSVVPLELVSNGVLETAPDVSIGPASAVTLDSGARVRRIGAELTTFDLAAGVLAPNAAFRIRTSLAPALYDVGYRDGQLRVDAAVSKRMSVAVSALWVVDRDERDDIEARDQFVRVTAAATYHADRWTTRFALSTMPATLEMSRGMLQHRDIKTGSIDTRIDAVRRLTELAGLTDIEWQLGEQTSFTRHDLDIAWPFEEREGSPQPQHAALDDTSATVRDRFWTPDAALWTALGANLAANVRAVAGVRVDLFGRGGDVATQPRGEIVADVAPRTRLGIAAGAHRRAPERGDELLVDHLNPERRKQVTARLEHDVGGLTLQGNAYYIDRTRLVIRDFDGVLHNSGTGTSLGLELSAQLKLRGWFAWATGSLSQSTRKDFQTAKSRPAELDQPVRLGLLVTRRAKRWQIGGRVRVVSGLPTTAIQQSLYDADHDVYAPIFDRTYGARLPWRYQLDVRVDRTFRIGASSTIAAFLDVALSTSTLDYDYRFDYKARAAVTLPVLPFVGVRGAL
jgi:hypothetical protein